MSKKKTEKRKCKICGRKFIADIYNPIDVCPICEKENSGKKYCLICNKPMKKKGELCITCGRKKKELQKYLLETKGREIWVQNFKLVMVKQQNNVDDVFAYIKENPSALIGLNYDKKNRFEAKNALKKELKSPEYSNQTYIKNSSSIPQYVNDLFKNLPQYELITIEGDKQNPYLYCKCKKCNKEFRALYSNFSRTQGHGCDAIISSGEAIVKKYLEDNDIRFKTQRNALQCQNPKTKSMLPYDFELSDYKIIIEVQGEQHVKYIEYFHGCEENFAYQQYKDKYKKDFAIRKGYKYLELFYNEIESGEYINKIQNLINKKG